MLSVFLWVIETLAKVWENTKELWKHSLGPCFHSISRAPRLPLVFQKLDRNTVNVFYFRNNLIRIAQEQFNISGNITIVYIQRNSLFAERFSVVVSSLVLSPEVATGVENPDDESVSDSLSFCPSGVWMRGTWTGLNSTETATYSGTCC